MVSHKFAYTRRAMRADNRGMTTSRAKTRHIDCAELKARATTRRLLYVKVIGGAQLLQGGVVQGILPLNDARYLQQQQQLRSLLSFIISAF